MFHVSLSHSIVVLGALAVGRALKFSLEIGISSAILEGDMEIVLNAISSVASFDLLIQDTKIVGEYFYSVIFSHIRKNGNSVVYNFARVHLK